MSKRKGKGTHKTRAIQNTVARLGMHAKPQQVVAVLADLGIDVSAGQVRQVQVAMLKQAAQVERQQVKVPKIKRPEVRPPKVPPRRGYRP